MTLCRVFDLPQPCVMATRRYGFNSLTGLLLVQLRSVLRSMRKELLRLVTFGVEPEDITRSSSADIVLLFHRQLYSFQSFTSASCGLFHIHPIRPKNHPQLL